MLKQKIFSFKKENEKNENEKKKRPKMLNKKSTFFFFTEGVCENKGYGSKREKRITKIRSHMVSLGISQTVARAGDTSMHIW